MSISKITRALALAATVPAVALVPLSAAVAQPQTCPTPGADAVTLNVTSPSSGAPVGGRVEVTGRFDGPGPVFQVELFVGDSRKDAIDVTPPSPSGSFTLAWDTAGATGGPVRLGVVACGGDPAAGSLVRGSAAVDVDVQASEAASPPPAALVAVEAGTDGPGSKPWVVLAMGGPGLVGLGYALGVRPVRRRPHERRMPPEQARG